MKKPKNKNLTFILIALCVTTSLMVIKKSFLNNNYNSPPLRNLDDEYFEQAVCKKARSEMLNKYQYDFNEETNEVKTLNSAQRSLVNFAKKAKFNNIKPYFKRVAIFIVFIILDIILIFLWISYCGCCCCNCCLFKRSNKSSNYSRICFFISVFFILLAIIFSIVELSLVKPFTKRINGVSCATHKFMDHVIIGLEPNYIQRAHEWRGIVGVVFDLFFYMLI